MEKIITTLSNNIKKIALSSAFFIVFMFSASAQIRDKKESNNLKVIDSVTGLEIVNWENKNWNKEITAEKMFKDISSITILADWKIISTRIDLIEHALISNKITEEQKEEFSYFRNQLIHIELRLLDKAFLDSNLISNDAALEKNRVALIENEKEAIEEKVKK